MSTSRISPSGPAPYASLALTTSTLTTGLILGSTSWASLAVMPSLIAAPISTYAKLSVFKGLILRANAILPPIFILASTSLAYLTYHAPGIVSNTGVSGIHGIGGSRLGSMIGLGKRGVFGLGLASMIGSLLLQIIIVPKNKAMLDIVEKGEGKDDERGVEGNQRIGELWQLNLVRVVCAAVAFVVSVAES